MHKAFKLHCPKQLPTEETGSQSNDTGIDPLQPGRSSDSQKDDGQIKPTDKNKLSKSPNIESTTTSHNPLDVISSQEDPNRERRKLSQQRLKDYFDPDPASSTITEKQKTENMDAGERSRLQALARSTAKEPEMQICRYPGDWHPTGSAVDPNIKMNRARLDRIR
jgi:hypothetical protein